MSILTMAKILTNLSLYYALISLFGGCGDMLPVAMSILCCTAGVGIAARGYGVNETKKEERSKAQVETESSESRVRKSVDKRTLYIILRLAAFFLLALPFVALRPFTQGRVGTGIISLIPAVYCVILILMGNLRVDYNRFETHLKVSAIVFLFLLAISAFWSSTWTRAAAFTVLYLYCGTWLLRQLRLKEGSDTKVRVLDALISAGILLAVYLAGGLLLFLLGYARNFASVLLIPLEAILYVLAWLFFMVMSLFPQISPEIPQSLTMMESMSSDGTITEDYGNAQSGTYIKIILIMIAAAIVLTVVIRLIRTFKNQTESEPLEEKRIRREKISRAAEPRHLFGGGSPNTVRKLYRRYLKRLKADGMETYPGMTSEEVCAAAETIHGNGTADQQIREIYKKVRYKQGYVAGEQELADMKKLTR